MENVGLIIKRLRQDASLTQEELAKRVGVSKQTINNYEHNRREPDLKMLYDLAAVFNVSVETFVSKAQSEPGPAGPFAGRTGEPLSFSPDILALIDKAIKDAIPYSPPTVMVPVVGSVRCGPGGLAYQEYQGTEPADVANPKDYLYLRAEGDSMLPDIRPGDLVLVHIQPEVDNGDLAVVVIDGEEGTLKKFMRKGDTVVLQSFNQQYPPRVFVGDEINTIKIAGRVVEIKRKW